MRKCLALLLIFLTLPLNATVFLSPGVSLTLPHQSEEKNTEGLELIKLKRALGIDVDLEWMFWGPLSLNLSGVWRGGEATSQYSYTNPSNPLDAAVVDDLETNASNLSGYAGGRWRLLNKKYIKIFVGGGVTTGILYLTYDQNKFEVANASIIGFKEKEDQTMEGTYLEGGVELFSTKGGALRLLGRQSKQRTKKFETLNNRSINIATQQFSIQYMHPF